MERLIEELTQYLNSPEALTGEASKVTTFVSRDGRCPTVSDFNRWILEQLNLRGGDPNAILENSNQAMWNFLQRFDEFVLFEDPHILVVDKPAGISSHYPSKFSFGVEEIARHLLGDNVCLAHRLDKDTTGVLVLAKSQEAHDNLQAQFSNKASGSMEKVYLAVLDGELNFPPIKVSATIARTATEKMREVKPWERAGGRPSLTIFQPLAVLSNQAGFSRTLTRVQPITGITHQIRVISADYLGTPVAGDRMYNPNPDGVVRPMLHAFELTFQHPITKDPMTISSPIPQDFRDFVSTMDWRYFIA